MDKIIIEAVQQVIENKELSPVELAKKRLEEKKQAKKIVTDVNKNDLKSYAPNFYKGYGTQAQMVSRAQKAKALGIDVEKGLEMTPEEMLGYKAVHNDKMNVTDVYGFKNTAKHVITKGVSGVAAGAATGAAAAAAKYGKDGMATGAATGALIGGLAGVGAGLLTPAFRYYKGRRQAYNEDTEKLKKQLINGQIPRNGDKK